MIPEEKRKQVKEHVKVKRILNLLKYLSSNISYSLAELSEKINVSERTVRRYINSFEKAGLFIEKNNGFYRLKRMNYYNDINSILHFSEEEALLLNNAINAIESSSLTNINLKNKLYALYNSDRVNYPILKQSDSPKVKIIINAIENKKKVQLIYKSSNTGKIKERIVEPFKFTTNYQHVWAFENEFANNYLFRISRIQEIKLLDENWTGEENHKVGEIDIFRINDKNEINFELQLTLRGYNYLLEQYPLAEKYITKISDNEYILKHWAANFEGISRFILSIIDDVIILNPLELKDYINRKIKNKIF